MIVGEPRPKDVDGKILVRKVVLDKTLDGKESLKITIQASRPEGQENPSADASRPVT